MDYLSAIEQPNVLLLLDDFFLRSPVDTQRVLETLSFHQRHAAIQTRLVPRPPPTDTIPGERLIGKCAPGSPYRLSTQAAFWNKAYLMRLLNPGEAIWAFEKLGNERALEFQEGFYAARSQVIPYVGIFTHHVVEKGAWFIHEKWIFSRKNIGCDFSKRRTLPLWQTAIYQLAQITNIGLLILPWRWRVVISAMLKATARQLLGKGVERLGAPPT